MSGLRARARPFLAAALTSACGPPGQHRAGRLPETAVPAPRPAADEAAYEDDGWGVPPSMMTMLDIPPQRARPFVPGQGGRHHEG